MNFDFDDLQRGYKLCTECKNRVHHLESGFDCEQTKCGKCNLWTSKEADFFNNESKIKPLN